MIIKSTYKSVGKYTLDTTSAYNYTIVTHATGFQARVIPKPGENLEELKEKEKKIAQLLINKKILDTSA